MLRKLPIGAIVLSFIVLFELSNQSGDLQSRCLHAVLSFFSVGQQRNGVKVSSRIGSRERFFLSLSCSSSRLL